jgi:hypothetical protein
LLLLGVLPVAMWIPGGLADPMYPRRWAEWGYGTIICAGVGAIALLVARRVKTAGRRVFHSPFFARVAPSDWHVDLILATGSAVVYGCTAWLVLDARPLLIDEIVQVWQARMYASGSLSIPTDSARAFWSVLHVVDIGDRAYGQFPPGWPAMLALGSLVGAEWLIGPVCGGVAVLAFTRLLRRQFGVHSRGVVAVGAMLFALSPFVLFQFASHMSHGPALMWLLLALGGLPTGNAEDGKGPRSAFLAGLAAGCLFAVRPLDGMAFMVPAAAWVTWQVMSRQTSLQTLLAVAGGWVLPVLMVCWVNWQTTGAPTVFGYEVLWGASHGLGFHSAPWGDPHTLQRALELLSLYITRLNAYLFEAPFPSLLPAVGTLVLMLPLSRIERYLIAATSLHATLYAAYWHDGFYLGPRFVLLWVPAIVLLTLRFGIWLLSKDRSQSTRVATIAVVWGSITLVVAVSVPARAGQYRSGLASMRVDYGREAERAGVQGALVFVRESWGAQLVARLWAIGVSRSAAASLYGRVDACALEHAVTNIEESALRGERAEAVLRQLLADSARVVSSTLSPDSTERMLPGMVYDSTCTAHVLADREGYALYPPFILDQRSGNTYARDLGALDTLVMNQRRDRPAYRVYRAGANPDAALVWTRLRGDTLR